MYRISANVDGLPFPKEKQMETLLELLLSLQRDAVVLTGAVFSEGEIHITARVTGQK